MARTQLFDLESSQNEVLLNPRWPQTDYQSLQETALKAQEQLDLKSHVWIATSGSTASEIGSTKLVCLSKKALVASARSVNQHLQSVRQDIWAQVLPHFHVGGLGIEMRAFLAGARVVDALKEERWDPLYFYKTMVEQKCTLTALVPTQIFDLVMTHKLQAPKSLRAVVIGGGAFEPGLYLRARDLGWPVLPSYGMTETASQIATASLDSLKEITYPAIRLLNHAKARTTKDGYLEVWAESLFTSYAQRKMGGQVQVWDPKRDSWFKTEDRGFVDLQDGLIIEGRSQDYIKIGGEATNIAQLRLLLENKLAGQKPEWVNQVALVDVASERLGSEIHLVTTLEQSQALSVQKMYESLVRPFEKIRGIHYVTEIPRSDLGKIKWTQLRSLI